MVDSTAAAATDRQRPFVLWLTGLSGAGKSSIAERVEGSLADGGRRVFVLDGDVIRRGLCRDLGFSAADRAENVRRVAEVARLMLQARLTVLVALISPLRSERAAARALFDEGAFIEVHVDTPLALAEQRDVKGLYAKARRGELPLFTGIDSPYEAPERPEVRIRTSGSTVEQSAAEVLASLRARRLVD